MSNKFSPNLPEMFTCFQSRFTNAGISVSASDLVRLTVFVNLTTRFETQRRRHQKYKTGTWQRTCDYQNTFKKSFWEIYMDELVVEIFA